MPKKIISVRLDEDLISEVDKLCPKRGERSDFISDAISEKLHGALDVCEEGSGETKSDLVRPGEAIPIPRKGVDGQAVNICDLKPDAVVLLSALRQKRMASREAEKSMGWLGLRYSKAERSLIGAGLVAVVDGVLVPTDGAY